MIKHQKKVNKDLNMTVAPKNFKKPAKIVNGEAVYQDNN